jgi:predicted dehydrogenase
MENRRMKKIGIGIIGLGYIGQIHLRSSLKVANATVVAVADLSTKALNKAKKAGIRKVYTNYEELLKEPEVEAVVIALPTHLHLKCALEAMHAKKHVLLEKPMARNVVEAEEILKTSEKSSVKLMIGYPLRFTETFRNLKMKIETGELGDLESAYATSISTGPFMHRADGYSPIPVPEWWFKTELTGGGALIDLGSHMINLLRWYFGEVTDIKAHLRHRFNMDPEDHAICLARFESGTTAVINVGWFLQGYQCRVELVGTTGQAVGQNVPLNRVLAALQMLTTGTSTFWQPYASEVEHFVSCITTDTESISSGNDGLRDLQAIESAYKNSIQMDN